MICTIILSLCVLLLVVCPGQEWVRDFFRPLLGRDQTDLRSPYDNQSQSSGLARYLFWVVEVFGSLLDVKS